MFVYIGSSMRRNRGSALMRPTMYCVSDSECSTRARKPLKQKGRRGWRAGSRRDAHTDRHTGVQAQTHRHTQTQAQTHRHTDTQTQTQTPEPPLLCPHLGFRGETSQTTSSRSPHDAHTAESCRPGRSQPDHACHASTQNMKVSSSQPLPIFQRKSAADAQPQAGRLTKQA